MQPCIPVIRYFHPFWGFIYWMSFSLILLTVRIFRFSPSKHCFLLKKVCLDRECQFDPWLKRKVDIPGAFSLQICFEFHQQLHLGGWFLWENPKYWEPKYWLIILINLNKRLTLFGSILGLNLPIGTFFTISLKLIYPFIAAIFFYYQFHQTQLVDELLN